MKNFETPKEKSPNKEPERINHISVWSKMDVKEKKQETKESKPYNPELFLAGKFSFVFNGQGSHPPLQEIQKIITNQEFNKTDEILYKNNIYKNLGHFLMHCTEEEYEELLMDTAINQLIVYTYQQILSNYFNEYWKKIFNQAAPQPINITGNSLGMYNALTSSGNFSFDNGLNIVAKRGLGMRLAYESNPDVETRIVAGLPFEVIEHIKKYLDLSIANYNSPTQTTFSGKKSELRIFDKLISDLINQLCDKNNNDKQIQTLRQYFGYRDDDLDKIKEKIKIIKGKIRGIFHTKYTMPALEIFEPALSKLAIHENKISVLPDNAGEVLTTTDDIKKFLIDHITNPVCFPDTLKKMDAKAIIVFGGRQTSANFTKETLPEIKNNIISLTTKNEIEKFIEKLRDETRI
ncbi:MAG: hypothetical protein RBS77_03235 [Candidatus Moranbacteria bacterium]|jgi:malonyl CoA-acyl carrier protein transacylase|nr:hypothetical protein [Candidatus Moranbacteria bacterium]